jgi:hypothetical protein
MPQRNLARGAAAPREPLFQAVDADLVHHGRLPNFHLQGRRLQQRLAAPIATAELIQSHASRLVQRSRGYLHGVLDALEIAKLNDPPAGFGNAGSIHAIRFLFAYDIPRFVRNFLSQYVNDHPTTVIVSTSSNAPTLTTLNAFPCPSK